MDDDIIAAHKFSIWHRDQLSSAGGLCGCFHCCRNFSVKRITEWTDYDDSGVGQTAMCPFCGIDSVIGAYSGYSIDPEFLKRMKKHWFS